MMKLDRSIAQNPMLSDRRRSLRLQVAVQIEIRLANSSVPMRLETTDLSLGGCYVETTATLEVGTTLDIVLWLQEQKVSTKAVVVTRHSQFGNGVQFLGMSAENESRLLSFIDSKTGLLQIGLNRTAPY